MDWIKREAPVRNGVFWLIFVVFGAVLLASVNFRTTEVVKTRVPVYVDQIKCDAFSPNFAFASVKWFNVNKGFGFLAPLNGAADVFLHQNELNGFHPDKLPEGQLVVFETIVGSDNRKQARLIATLAQFCEK